VGSPGKATLSFDRASAGRRDAKALRDDRRQAICSETLGTLQLCKSDSYETESTCSVARRVSGNHGAHPFGNGVVAMMVLGHGLPGETGDG
jgi:hypothetical protein